MRTEHIHSLLYSDFKAGKFSRHTFVRIIFNYFVSNPQIEDSGANGPKSKHNERDYQFHASHKIEHLGKLFRKDGSQISKVRGSEFF